MNFRDIVEVAWAEAFASKLDGDEAAMYRGICRIYSKTFHTPLHVVENELDPLYVVRSVYEDQLDSSKLDDVETVQKMLEMIYSLEDPNYEVEQEGDLKEFMEEAEQEESERVKSGTKLFKHLSAKKKESTEPAKELPKSGGINLAYLDEENER